MKQTKYQLTCISKQPLRKISSRCPNPPDSTNRRLHKCDFSTSSSCLVFFCGTAGGFSSESSSISERSESLLNSFFSLSFVRSSSNDRFAIECAISKAYNSLFGQVGSSSELQLTCSDSWESYRINKSKIRQLKIYVTKSIAC